MTRTRGDNAHKYRDQDCIADPYLVLSSLTRNGKAMPMLEVMVTLIRTGMRFKMWYGMSDEDDDAEFEELDFDSGCRALDSTKESPASPGTSNLQDPRRGPDVKIPVVIRLTAYAMLTAQIHP